MAPCSEESCRVFSAHYIVAFLRGCAVLASRRELQHKGVLEPDCPVCLDMLAAGNGVVTFRMLECGHRCEAVAAVRPLTATQSPHGRMCSVPGHHPPRALSRCVRRRIHKECLLKIKKRRTPSGAVRMCPLCRVASRTKHTFKLRGEMA